MASNSTPPVGELMFGIETEYAASVLDRRGRPLDRMMLVTGLTSEAAKITRSMPAHGCHAYDYFLQNGARLYIDCGLHPEYSSPECTTPEEMICHSRAGGRLLERAARQYQRSQRDIGEILISRCNVDYSSNRATWGSHESYLHGCTNTTRLADQLVPHLVSRIVLTGAGGFDNRSPGIEFMLAPRTVHLVRTSSNTTTSNRAIFNTKNEALCRGYRRLHLICGESLCSHRADYLRVGSTALVVALIAAGRDPGEAYKPSAPVQAMRSFARDPDCETQVLLTNGRSAGAIEIQRHYLQQVEDQLGAKYLPRWAEDCCRLWRATLDELEQGHEALATTLDWPIKLALFRQCAEQHGFDWQQLDNWNKVLRSVERAGSPVHVRPLRELLDLFEEGSDTADTVKRLSQRLRKAGLPIEQLEAFRTLRSTLFEMDTRFSQLGKRGIFANLDAAGVLNHRMVSERRIARAMRHPPAIGRARLRSRIITASDNKTLRCRWDHILDGAAGRRLDMSDPWEGVNERWVNL